MMSFLKPSALPNIPIYHLATTLWLSTFIIAVFIVGQSFGLWLFSSLLFSHQNLDLATQIQLASQHGTVFAYTCYWICFLIVISLWMILQANNPNPKDPRYFLKYLGFCPIKIKVTLIFIIALICFNIMSTTLFYYLNIQPLQFFTALYQSAEPIWLLLTAIVLVVPIYEEMIFRGFMWLGIANSRLGIWWASVISSVIFTLIHAQYVGLALLMIFLLSMLLSLARAISGSLWLPIVLHILNNGMAMLFYIFIEKNM